LAPFNPARFDFAPTFPAFVPNRKPTARNPRIMPVAKHSNQLDDEKKTFVPDSSSAARRWWILARGAGSALEPRCVPQSEP
jgi:hypothetical protein